ncbi:hypothetical protein JOD43_003664 [Pullulanibacillus pueri]|uniref:Sporulation protein n=1 Tax=Pullulanibacillus pueri TaxID=1437324 RepID=A0A8J2ZZK7_9BACL|nr:YtrH family sporulation protein [Pullulanibacillus pueri]MBM7683484.1 hypothetical protein [Pullulanibacillus pueri]GGH86729.1 sporulation protein [Pullulanibacillus pueri]
MDFREFASSAIMNFLIAMGLLIGGCLLSGIGAMFVSKPPLFTMNEFADKLKIWAIVAAIGGTFDTIDDLENSFFGGAPGELVKHLLLIGSAMTGAHTASLIIHWITQEY